MALLRRVVVALGGNAMTGPDGAATPAAQRAAIMRAAQHVADVVATGAEVVVTHGNGPQVGNLLVKNELAAHVVPPVPLDWNVAQTQATIGLTLLNTLDAALEERGLARRTAAVLTRTLVDPDDPAFIHPTKPVGRYLPEAEARARRARGESWQDRGEKGWRRVVPSPEPRVVLDADTVLTLLDAGYLVVANGGGGVPVARGDDGGLCGVEAVVDKDLGAALLGRTVRADLLLIATDVPAAMLHYGTPEAEPLGEVPVSRMRALAAQGHFTSGSMGPKVEAVCRFVERGGQRAAITSLACIADAVSGRAGTVVEPG